MISDAAYGKSGIRLVKLARHGGRHHLTDLTVAIRFEGDYDASYTAGDNRDVLPTDTMKNTVYALAADATLDDPEPFGLLLARHFLDRNPRLQRVRVELVQRPWERLSGGDGQAFVDSGPERRTAAVSAARGAVTIEAGVADLFILKSSRSGFSGFLRDELTTLADTDDRILATSLAAVWEYRSQRDVPFAKAWRAVRDTLLASFAEHRSASVQHTLHAMGQAVLEARPDVLAIRLSMPNRHHLPVDLTPFGLENRNEIFVATDAPFGLIEATVRRTERH